MSQSNIRKHISAQYNEDLENARHRVLRLGGLVEQQLTCALTAITSSDRVLAAEVVEKHATVRELEASIEHECTRIIAKRQPTASDLRLVLAIFKTITELARIGNEARRIANAVTENKHGSVSLFASSVESLGARVQVMLGDTLDAFARLDLEAGKSVSKQDKKIDKKYELLIEQLTEHMMKHPSSIPQIMDVMWSVRALERIGDRCQNICDYVLYFVDGSNRHLT